MAVASEERGRRTQRVNAAASVGLGLALVTIGLARLTSVPVCCPRSGLSEMSEPIWCGNTGFINECEPISGVKSYV